MGVCQTPMNRDLTKIQVDKCQEYKIKTKKLDKTYQH